METEIKMVVLCLFCQQPFQLNKNEKLEIGGGLLKCKSCGEDNDSDSLIASTKERAIKKIEKEGAEALSKKAKNILIGR